MIGLLFAAPAFVAPASALVSRRAAVTMNAEPEATRDSAPPVAFTTPPTRATGGTGQASGGAEVVQLGIQFVPPLQQHVRAARPIRVP